MEQTLRELIDEESQRIDDAKEQMIKYILRCKTSIMQYCHAYTGQLINPPSILWDSELDAMKEKYPHIDFDAHNEQAQQFKARYDDGYAQLAFWTIRLEGASYTRDLAIRNAIEHITGVVPPNNGVQMEDLDEELEKMGH